MSRILRDQPAEKCVSGGKAVRQCVGGLNVRHPPKSRMTSYMSSSITKIFGLAYLAHNK